MSAPSEPLRVLVIDDDKALAETIGESLERRGHAVTVCTTGKSGVAKLEQDAFDVVLTDLARRGALSGLQVKGATLEDVFLALTGREYRA